MKKKINVDDDDNDDDNDNDDDDDNEDDNEDEDRFFPPTLPHSRCLVLK